jgi:hypothetical protein
MDQKYQDWLVIGLAVVIILFFLWKGVSTFASATFSPEMPEGLAASIFQKTTDDINREMTEKLNEALAKNDLAATKKIGDDGHAAILKLQKDYHDYLKAIGKPVEGS